MKNTRHPRFVGGRVACVAVALLGALSPSTVPAGEAVKPEAPISLINGDDLTGWVVVGKDGDAAAKDTWSVCDGVLAATGAPYGYARTTQAFHDYRLRVEWRWVPGDAPLDAQGKPRGRNSGVLLHIEGEDKVWPACLEAQLQQGNAGDMIAMASSVVFDELRAMREQASRAAGSDAAARERALSGRRVARQHESSEKPVGEWNVYEIVCRGSTVSLTVNGVLQNTAAGLTLGGGSIGLQSEGMPIEFRRIELSPLEP